MKKVFLLSCAIAFLPAILPEPALAGSTSDPSAVSETSSSVQRNVLSEVRAGFLIHDRGLFIPRRETGQDLNVEVLFRSPRWKLFQAVWSPRPHVGISISDAGQTSQLYGGFTWEWRPFGNAFIDGSLGLSVHDGHLRTSRPDREGLGSRVLFRESIELGYRFHARHALSFIVDHISNAGLAPENDGITSTGFRYGYRF